MTRFLPSSAAALVVLALVPAAASAAKGGDKPAPAPTPTQPQPQTVRCDFAHDGVTPDGLGYVFSSDVEFSGPDDSAGCLTLQSRSTSVSFVSMALTPGFSYRLQTTTDGVKVTFTRLSTGETREWRIEPGKTVVR